MVRQWFVVSTEWYGGPSNYLFRGELRAFGRCMCAVPVHGHVRNAVQCARGVRLKGSCLACYAQVHACVANSMHARWGAAAKVGRVWAKAVPAALHLPRCT